MNLTMAQIKADLIAAKQAIAYYDEKPIKDMKNMRICIRIIWKS